MQELNIALVAVACMALVQGLLSKPLKRYGLPDSITLFALGVILGPQGFALLIPSSWGEPMQIMEQASRLALAIGLMGVALRLPKGYVIQQWRSLTVLLVLGMIFMCVSSSLIMGSLLGLSLGTALVIGAVITPTDPVVASAIVTGPVVEKNLPEYLRHIISAESGANDGLAYLFVMGAIFYVVLPESASLSNKILSIFIDIVVALLLGGIIGYSVGFALRKAEEHDLIEDPSILMMTIALALGTLAVVKLVGSDGILAVFVAGLAFDQQVSVEERLNEERVVEGVDRFFTSPVFILLGMMVPWREWLDLGWRAPALIAAFLLLRRLPLVLLLGGRLAALPRRADGAFTGWFGPLGVAALYYAAMVHHYLDLPQLWPVVTLLVTASIFFHGLSAMPFSRWYGAAS